MLQDWLKPERIWFLIGFIMLLLEFALPGLIIFFFGLGAWIVAVICFFVDISIKLQLIIFIMASLLLLITLRQWTGKIIVGRRSQARLSEFVGEKAVVTRQIDPDTGGRVEFQGTSWPAEADEQISEGAVVEVIGKNNITLKVKKLSREVNMGNALK